MLDMNEPHAHVHLTNGEMLICRIMYVIGWRGKSMSGSERLLKGSDITRIDIVDEDGWGERAQLEAELDNAMADAGRLAGVLVQFKFSTDGDSAEDYNNEDVFEVLDEWEAILQRSKAGPLS